MQLRTFIADLGGLKPDAVEVVTGRRHVPELPSAVSGPKGLPIRHLSTLTSPRAIKNWLSKPPQNSVHFWEKVPRRYRHCTPPLRALVTQRLRQPTLSRF